MTSTQASAQDDLEIASKYADVSMQEHVRSKDMWAGSSTATEHTDYVWSGGGVTIETLTYPPALYKSFDEPIVNAEDHQVKNPKLVTEIKIGYTPDGVFSVMNDGPGVEVQKHPADGVWVPQRVFGVLFKGSNLQASKSIVGGTHGVGVKLSNIFSKWFVVETVDARPKYRLKYTQKWTDGMKVVDDPTITSDMSPPYTRVSFLPDYFGAFKWGENVPTIDEIVNMFTKILYMRAVRLASYVGYVSGGKTRVYWNGELIPIKSMTDLSKIMFPGADTVSVDLCTEAQGDPYVSKYWWEVVVVKLTTPPTGVNHLSNVNGVSVRKGAHVDWIFEQIVGATRDAVTKELGGKNVRYRQSYITDTVFLLVNAQIPGVKWEGQRKDEAMCGKTEIRKWSLDAKTIGNLSTHALKSSIEQIYLKTETGSTSSKTKVSVDKYTPAEYAGTRQADKCYLLLGEGDSAASFLRAGVMSKREGALEPHLGFKWYGILSLGGVIINARRKSKSIEIGGVERHVLSQQLLNNKFIKSFLEVMGLKVTYKYDPTSPTFKKEWSELRYRGGVIICVDQDHAGEGFICSLVLNVVALYWPNLLKLGLFKRFITPYLRAYPKRGGKVFEFTSTYEFKNWATLHDPSNYELKYIKGLGTHESSDIKRMFLRFHDFVYTYTMDRETKNQFEIYFGKDAEPRKAVLRVPLEQPSAELIATQQATKQILSNDHLRFKMKEHMEEDLVMKLWHCLDGLNESGRKITHAVRRRFAHSNDEIKVSQLAGYVGEHEEYHYGEQSLYSNIIGKGYVVVGGVQLPIVIPIGMFGTRNKAVGIGKESGKLKVKDDSAAPRYIFTTLNKKLSDVLYPVVDDPLLKYRVVDGQQVEPTHYLPIVPPVFESTEIPSEGWKIKVWAREITDVIRAVRLLIDIPNIRCLPRMRPYTFGHKGSIRYIRGEPYSVGNYWFNESANEIVVTELPLRVWTAPYAAYIKAKKQLYVDDVINHSSDTDVNVRVVLKPGAIEKIEALADGMWTDGVEEYLELRVRMDSHINMIGPEGGVVSFESYERVVYNWFPYRRDMYSARISRIRTVLELQIRLIQLIEKYIDARSQLTHPTITEAEATERLVRYEYPRLTTSIIKNPGFLPTAEIVQLAVNGPKSSYDYLFDLRQSDMFVEARDRRVRELNRLEEELKTLETDAAIGLFPGAAIWHRELDELERVVAEGRATKWMFGKTKKFTYD